MEPNRYDIIHFTNKFHFNSLVKHKVNLIGLSQEEGILVKKMLHFALYFYADGR